jgi:hypothetical protein
LAGKRQNSDATLGNAGTGAGYWSATVNGTDANSRGFNSISTNSNSDTAEAASQFVASNTIIILFFLPPLGREVYIDVTYTSFLGQRV